MKNQLESNHLQHLVLLLDSMEDPRNAKLAVHPLPEILFLLVVGTLCGYDELTVIASYGREKVDWLRKYYPYQSGVPSHDTLNRVLGLIDKRAFEKLFVQWVAQSFDLADGELINIDGKRLNSSADRASQSKKRAEGGEYAQIIVNVYAAGAGIVLAQNNVTDKMDEVKGAHELLDWLSLEGCCVSGDSNFCGRKLIDKVISSKADYLLALKGKSPKILEAAKAGFDCAQIPKVVFQTEETGHGRHEKRVYRSIRAQSLPGAVTSSYAQLNQVVEVMRSRTVTRTGKYMEETHYYLTSLESGPEQLADKIRRHWSIENQLHYVLDVSFGEDACRSRIKNAASNLSLIRKISLNLLRLDPEPGSIKTKRMRLAVSDQRRDDLFEKIMMR
jgi:predicted transposase YbfD/YdcC